jgi:hypothetical protein
MTSSSMGGVAGGGRTTTSPDLAQSTPLIDPRLGTPTLTVGEFLHEVEASRNPDKITAIAAYLKRHRGVGRFTRDDVRAEFPRAGEKVPGNYTRDFTWAVTNKWIAIDASAGEGEHYITGSGLAAVDAKFSAEVRKASRQKSSRRRTSRKKNDDQE